MYYLHCLGEQFSCCHFMISFFRKLKYLESGLFYVQLTLRQLLQPDLEPQFVGRSQLGPSILSGSRPVLVLDYRQSQNHTPIERLLLPTGYPLAPKFCLQNSCIKDACHYTRPPLPFLNSLETTSQIFRPKQLIFSLTCETLPQIVTMNF